MMLVTGEVLGRGGGVAWYRHRWHPRSRKFEATAEVLMVQPARFQQSVNCAKYPVTRSQNRKGRLRRAGFAMKKHKIIPFFEQLLL